MIEVLYTCTLLSDVVLNSKLATEGNMETLDFIPGSNFLGIIANDIYKNFELDEAYDILHSNKVLFGDAHISDSHNSRSYAMPLVLFKAKSGEGQTLVQYAIDKITHKQLIADGIQLKQERKGYLTETGIYFKEVKKDFALKSAQDRNTRSSAEGQMFGVSSLAKGQIFTFTIKYESVALQKKVEAFLIGKKQIGKSKTAQFGQVDIQQINEPEATSINQEPDKDNIVYAESNLCFFSDLGHPSFQPSADDLGINGGNICWEKSQIRTYTYSPWNFKRNTPNTQRHCIQKGSVFYVKGGVINNPDNIVGEYTNEGLGRVLYNPCFLKANEDATWALDLQQGDKEEPKPEAVQISSMLGLYLKSKKEESENQKLIARSVHNAVYGDAEINNPRNISPSQWGAISTAASKSASLSELRNWLFDEEAGFVTKGVSVKKYWDKNRNREKLQKIIEDNDDWGTVFVARYAEEMAKKSLKSN